jgi:hypothetical protein
MRVRSSPVDALGTLLRVTDDAQRRASFRQAIAALGHRAGLGLQGAPPLDGMDQDVIQRALGLALEVGLVDDLDWLAPGSAAVALYELTAALPVGKVRHELGRRVFARLYEGTAATFAAVATRMALASGRPFETATLRARVGLLFDLPVGSGVNADALALTIVIRRELRERWIDAAKTGTLPARRLAAKLFEYAAREAASRAQAGDSHPRQLLTSNGCGSALSALLMDREPLVWRHAAVARGLLAGVDSRLREEVELSLDPALSPTEWRRGAVSLVALIASDPEEALRASRRVLEGPLAERDPGIAATLVLGLPRVVEAEPAAAETLLDWISRTRRPDVAEAVAALLGDVLDPSFGAAAAQQLREPLASHAEKNTSVLRTIAERALRQLDRDEDEDDSVGLVRRALAAYETQGARAAFELATKAVNALGRAVDFVVTQDPSDQQLLPYVLGTLKDVDTSALESPRLSNLLLLGRRPGDTDVTIPEMDRVYDKLGKYLVEAHAASAPNNSTGVMIANQRRMRALLHLMDVDSSRQEDDNRRVRARVRQTVRQLLEGVSGAAGGVAHRIAGATLARALDAAVRESMCEPADLLLVLASRVEAVETYQMIGEASTNPDVRAVVGCYAEFLNPMPEAADGSESPENSLRPEHDGNRTAQRIVRLSRGLGAGGSYRGEALRRVVLRLGRALESVADARGQSELVDTGSGADALSEVETALEDLARLMRGASRRLLGDEGQEITVVTDAPSLSALVERAVGSGVPANEKQLEMSIRGTVSDVPPALGSAVASVLERIDGLPVAAASDLFPIPLERRKSQLPDWLLPQRTIGAFYVIRALGSGGASSVFLARRLEERNNPKAEGFALKVPDYDPTTARSLSEQEFLQLFREEAGALLALPQHANLARFVTFDVGARPKPILVMEAIRGPSLDRLIRNRSLTTQSVLGFLDGILAGLEVMHGVGVAHLDIKPSNVIVRDGETPVLVDFGLSGRHLRPGCGSVHYCSPEVLGVAPEGAPKTPLPADIYAFGAMAFEALTSTLLFDGNDEMSIAQAHIAHDGWPPRLAAYAHAPLTRDIATLLAACLRRDLRHRPNATQVRRALAGLARDLEKLSWPLAPAKRRTA